MTTSDSPQDMTLRVVSDGDAGDKGLNRLIAYRNGEPVLMETGEMNHHKEGVTGPLKALYLAVERIAQLEQQVRDLMDDSTWAAQQLGMTRRDAVKQRLDHHAFGEGVTLESTSPLYDEDSDHWSIPITLRRDGHTTRAFFHVAFQTGSAQVITTEVKYLPESRFTS